MDRVRQRVAEREAEETKIRRNTLNKAKLFAPSFPEPFTLRYTAPAPEFDVPAGPTRTPRWLSSLESTLTFPDWDLPSSPQRNCVQVLTPQLLFLCSNSRKYIIQLPHLHYLLPRLHHQSVCLPLLHRTSTQKLHVLNLVHLQRKKVARKKHCAKQFLKLIRTNPVCG